MAKGLAIAVVMLVSGVLGWRWVNRKVDERSVKQVEEFMAAHDFRSAQLTMEQMVAANPQNNEVRKTLAGFYTQMGSPRALALWDELLAREPDNDAYAIGKAGAALQLKKYDIAANALARVSSAGREEASYKRHRAALALVTGDRVTLESELGGLAVLESGDLRMQFNSAAAAAFSQTAATAAEARMKLLGLAQSGPLRIRATLQLMRIAESQPDPEKAIADLAGAVLRLAPTRKAGAFELAEHMKADLSPAPDDAADLVEWMAGHGWPREALLWVSDLPAATQNDARVLRARVVCAALLQDWVRLQQLLQAGAWGRIPQGALELAFAARVQKEGVSSLRAMETWEDALALAAKNGGAPAFRGLERLAGLWAWPDAREKTLWLAHKNAPRDLVYLRQLAVDAETRGDVEQLEKVYDSWLAVYPDDRFAGASRLYLKVLKDDMDSGDRRQAATLISRPDVLPEEAVIWAWAEAKAGGGTAALARLAPMTAGIRLRYRASLIYAVLLADAGRPVEALEFLTVAAAQKMLPDERALLLRTRARLDPK